MSPAKSILPLALGGLLIGAMLGCIAAGGYVSWATGGDMANVGFTTIFEFLPSTPGAIPTTEPIRTALMVWGGLALALAVAVPAVGSKRQLTSHGSARWATLAEMRRAGLLTDLKHLNGPIYGKVGTPRSRAEFMSSRDIPHSLTSAPTGSGKTRSVVIPTMLTYPGSILCLDLKGELYAKTSRRRVAFGDTVYKFSPYAEDGRTHRYNPLQDVADTLPRRRFTEARRLAASFIVAHGGGEGFVEGARDIFAATALFVIEKQTPTIGAIFDALSQAGDAFVMLRRLGDATKAPEAKKIFHKMAGMESRVLSSYLSVLGDGGLSLWADPAVRAATSASDFSIRTLRSKPTTIYVVVSPNDLVPLAPLIRLMFQQTIAILQRAEPDLDKGEKYTVLFCLDEFPALGRMDALVSAIATLRSYGGRVMIVVQTIASLDIYGKEGAAVILANCRMQLFMAPADKDTPAYISAAIGDFTRKSRSRSWKGGDLSTSYQEREDGAPLIRPEQLRMLGENLIVALVQNSNPILVNKVLYDQDRVLKPLFENQVGPYPDPPQLPDDPVEGSKEPIEPKPSQDGAENPIAAERPAEEGSASVAAQAEDIGEAVNDREEGESEAEEFTRAQTFVGKSRVLLASIETARLTFDAQPTPDPDGTLSSSEPIPDQVGVDNSKPSEGPKEHSDPRAKGWKVDPAEVDAAHRQHLRDTGRRSDPEPER